MKNYVQLWFVRSWDAFQAPYQMNFVQSDAEANTLMSDINTITGGTSDKSMVYVVQNKFWLQQHLSQLANAGFTPLPIAFGSQMVSFSPFFLTKPEIKDWGVKNSNWVTDTADKNSVTALQLAEKRVEPPPTPDFEGAPGLYQFFLNLSLYASQLRAARRFREAGIVQYAYNQVVKQVWSITQAFDYLRFNRLL